MLSLSIYFVSWRAKVLLKKESLFSKTSLEKTSLLVLNPRLVLTDLLLDAVSLFRSALIAFLQSFRIFLLTFLRSKGGSWQIMLIATFKFCDSGGIPLSKQKTSRSIPSSIGFLSQVIDSSSSISSKVL